MHEVTMKKLYAFLLTAALLTSIAAIHFNRTFDPDVSIDKWPYKKKMAFTVSCDDISAGYPHQYLDEIEDILNRYGVRITFFVIPYHGEWDLLTDYPSFVDTLNRAEEKGHEIALHGYAHYEDEFVCSPEEQVQALENALSIMEEAGFTVKGFRAPCFKATPQTAGILKEYNFLYDSSTFGESGDVSFEGVLPEIPSGYEYSWYITGEDLPEMLDQAKMDFETQYSKESIFSLVIHMKAVNEGEGMQFLEDFLLYVNEREVWNFTLENLVEWTLNLQEVTWKSKKTITGGEITFEHIPQGLSAEIDLPLHYRLRDIPEGVEVITERENETQKVELVFHHDFEEVTVSFMLSYENQINNEVLILRNPSNSDLNLNLNLDSNLNTGDLNSLTESLNSWEINYRIVDTDYITSDLLTHSSTILIDKNLVKRSLTLKEEIALSSLKNRVIIFSGFDLGFPLNIVPTTEKKLMDYISLPLEIPLSKYKGFYDLGYYRIKILKGRSTYIYLEPIREDSPYGLYCNLLVRSLFASETLPVRQPFYTLEIDDCGMYEIGNPHTIATADVRAYQRCLDVSTSHGITPTYGFTTSYFSFNPEIEKIFSLLRSSKAFVANHGYGHSLNFINGERLAQEILHANSGIEALWGEPPRVIFVPCHEMRQETMVKVLGKTPIHFVGATDKGYTFGVSGGILFYERTSLQLTSDTVDAPPFLSLFLYSKFLPPSAYIVTHIFNYTEEGSACKYIDDALTYFAKISYTPSDTETMAEEDYFWNIVTMNSFRKGDTLFVELSGTEDLPEKEYTVHFMVHGTGSFSAAAGSYSTNMDVHYEGDITYVTLFLQRNTQKTSTTN
ncbi:MAG: DUF2334 domain-containing protein [Theionarchaea archaeon]|nr:DUF2334 domain-containing protein [Theionarchaea archaeon]